MSKHPYATYPNLASTSTGSRILFATDDFFAVAENLLSDSPPTFNPLSYTEFGKEMDGWETRRKRIQGHDFCIIELGVEGDLVGVEVDTAFFTGNNVPYFSIQVFDQEYRCDVKRSKMGGCALESDIKRIDCETKEWVKVIEKELKPGYPETRYNIFPIETKNTRFIRLNIFPDGGIARFKAFGVIKKELKGLCDIACVENGARAIEWSNAHYGTPMCLLSKLKSTGMHDGWETARNPNRPRIYTVTNGLLNMVGADWCIIELACKGRVEKIIVDTNHYKGNSPESVMIEYYDGQWKVLLERVKVKPHQEHEFVVNGVVADKVKLTMFPDGGVSRLRIFAQVDS